MFLCVFCHVFDALSNGIKVFHICRLWFWGNFLARFERVFPHFVALLRLQPCYTADSWCMVHKCVPETKIATSSNMGTLSKNRGLICHHMSLCGTIKVLLIHVWNYFFHVLFLLFSLTQKSWRIFWPVIQKMTELALLLTDKSDIVMKNDIENDRASTFLTSSFAYWQKLSTFIELIKTI